MIPAELVESMLLIGSEGFVRDRIAAHRAGRVTTLREQPVGPIGVAGIETVAAWLD